MGIPGHLHQAGEGVHGAFVFGQVDGSVEAGDGQLQIPQLANSGGDFMLVEGAALFQHGVEFGEVVDLNAGKAHFQSGVDHIIPGQVRPATGRK